MNILTFLVNKNNTRKLICCIWTLCCMIEADRVSLGGKIKKFFSTLYLFIPLVLNHCITREHFSVEPIDFEQKPITIDSLNERDVIVNYI